MDAVEPVFAVQLFQAGIEKLVGQEQAQAEQADGFADLGVDFFRLLFGRGAGHGVSFLSVCLPYADLVAAAALFLRRPAKILFVPCMQTVKTAKAA